ncbi:MAG: DUF2254 domain-containing protein [Verrucomicrobia bacterium]|nr:DUF2254 domain-containing protein [Verrucomicrobiota bacterium]
MTWLQRYRLSDYFRRSIWILPVLGMVVALGTVRVLHRIETAMGWESAFDPSTTLTLLGTLASAMFTLIVFVCSALLITVQLASAQLTPRVIGLVLQNPFMKLSLTLFVFTFTFTLAALVRIKGGVPPLTAHAAVYSCLVSLGVFFYLVDRVCAALRPSGALRSVARLGREVIQGIYPRCLTESQRTTPPPAKVLNEEPRATILNLREGVVLAFDLEGLVSLAQRSDCVIEMVPQVGDFVAADQPLFRIFGDGAPPDAAALYQSVAVGSERTLRQDPSFAFRIMVDIASKGLSPAINDPTTAVLAIDQIQHLLRLTGGRDLDTGRAEDARGTVRLLYRTPDWEDFVYLAVTEIRQFGGTSIQVARRLRAMLESLIQTLPQKRAAVLRLELDLLNRSSKRFFAEAEDRAMADVSDVQGVGGRPAQNDERQESRSLPGTIRTD